MRDYNSVFKSKAKTGYLKNGSVYGQVCVLLAVIITCGNDSYGFQRYVSAAGVMIVLYVLTPFTQRKDSAVKRIKNDLYCGFTEWLRDLAVNLENKPLLVSG